MFGLSGIEMLGMVILHTLTAGIMWPIALQNLISNDSPTPFEHQSNVVNLIFGLIGTINTLAICAYFNISMTTLLIYAGVAMVVTTSITIFGMVNDSRNNK